MIKTEIKRQIIADYKDGISLRKTAAKNNVSLDTVYKLTRTLIKSPKPPTTPDNTIYNKDIYIYKDISTLNALSTKDKENINIHIEENNNTKENINIKSNERDIRENISNERVITPNVNNISEDHKQLKVINSSIKKILKELKGIDYQKEKLKDLTTSLNSLNKQKQEITGTASGNTSIIQQIFNSPEQVQALLEEIRSSKNNPEAYIIKQQELQEA